MTEQEIRQRCMDILIKRLVTGRNTQGNEWVFEAGGLVFVCFKDDDGKTHQCEIDQYNMHCAM